MEGSDAPRTYNPKLGAAAATLSRHAEPRLVSGHWTAIERTCMADPGARLMGFDARQRPVLQAQVGQPRHWARWALTTTGAATDVTPPIAFYNEEALSESS